MEPCTSTFHIKGEHLNLSLRRPCENECATFKHGTNSRYSSKLGNFAHSFKINVDSTLVVDRFADLKCSISTVISTHYQIVVKF